VADLSEHKLGFCVLLKSNGSGLYATKDLALARRKFDTFKIDRSIYIVDTAQTLHFQQVTLPHLSAQRDLSTNIRVFVQLPVGCFAAGQVFKVLELFGYEKAKKCLHLPYGLVVLPTGKMSSRKGTVILFSKLTQMLSDQIDADYLNKYSGVWKDLEIAAARQAISVATIKFGMLNHDTAKDIVFNLKDWTAHGGMTGPYMLYSYARTQSILEKEKPAADAKVDLSLLSHERERHTLTMMHNFWPVVNSCLAKHNPSGLCEYIYDLAKAYSSWYDNDDCSVKKAKTPDLKATRLHFIRAFGAILKRGLGLLGITTINRM